MEYSAGSVCKLFWYIETKETVKLLKDNDIDDVKSIVVSNNLYQQKSEERLKREFNAIRERLMSLPESIRLMITDSDINTSKLIVIISIMATDRLFFEFMYEVYREKLSMDEELLKDSDLNVFFRNKQEQSDICAKWTDKGIKKLKQTFQKYMLEAMLLRNIEGTKTEKAIVKPYIEQDLRQELINNGMEKYLYALTGEK